MYSHSRLVAVLGCAATLATVGCATNSGLAPSTGSTLQQSQSHTQFGAGWIYKDGVLYHTPHYMATANAPRHDVSKAILLNYGNGPVLVKPKAYIIFWGYKTYGDTDGVAKLLQQYSKVMGGSSHNDIYTQYYEIVNSKTIDITNPKKQLGGVWFDDTNAVPAHPTDSQVAAEALNGVAKFGYHANGSYVVATPTGHSSAGFGSSFCAYHSATSYNGKLVSYTNLPYMPDAGGSCGANFTTPPSDESGVDEGVTIVEGHEYGESVTDPNPPSGWYNGLDGEIGDICAWQDIENDPFRSKSYTMQPMFSNATQSCVQSYP
jgi:serine protease